jgi:diacylglycerol kinase (ATP)
MTYWEAPYAYMSASDEGFTDQFLLIADLSDPSNPVEVGRWHTLDLDAADKMIENVVGVMGLPLGLGMNLVVNGIAGSNAHLGVLPLGNGNDFAKALGLPGDPLKALELIRNGKRGPLDLIRCRGDSETWCVNTLGIGLDGWANYYASQYQNVRGQAVYVLGILKAVCHFRGSNMQLIIDDEKMDKELLMVTVCNGPEEGGGFKVAPGASNSDGMIDLLTIEKMPVARILWYLPKFLFQPGKKLKGVRRVRCKKVTIESETPVAVHCDGQGLGTDIETISAEIRPGILQVIVP